MRVQFPCLTESKRPLLDSFLKMRLMKSVRLVDMMGVFRKEAVPSFSTPTLTFRPQNNFRSCRVMDSFKHTEAIM